MVKRLLLILLITVLLLGGSGGTLALDTTSTTTTVGGGEGEVNVFLGVETDDEGGDVDSLLANTGSNERLDLIIHRIFLQMGRTGCAFGG